MAFSNEGKTRFANNYFFSTRKQTEALFKFQNTFMKSILFYVISRLNVGLDLFVTPCFYILHYVEILSLLQLQAKKLIRCHRYEEAQNEADVSRFLSMLSVLLGIILISITIALRLKAIYGTDATFFQKRRCNIQNCTSRDNQVRSFTTYYLVTCYRILKIDLQKFSIGKKSMENSGILLTESTAKIHTKKGYINSLQCYTLLNIIVVHNLIQQSLNLRSVFRTLLKQPPQMFCKKGILRNFAKFTGKRLCRSILLKKRLRHRCFIVNFAEFFLQKISGRLFLTLLNNTDGDYLSFTA